MPRMYSLPEVAQMQALYARFRSVEEELLVFCSEVAKLLGWQGAERVELKADTVVFRAYWYGSYQSEDHELFSFPADYLVHGVGYVYEHIENKLQQANLERSEAERLRSEKVEREQYLRLKQKFEANNG